VTAHADASRQGGRTPAAVAPTRPRTAGRPRAPAVSREQIANAVVDLIGERGLHGWSMRDLGGRLGVSTGTITHYFRDKQTLLVSAMDAVYVLPADWDRYRARPPAMQLRHIAEMFVLDTARKRRWGRFWLAYLAGAAHDAALRDRQEERYDRQRRFFSRLIAASLTAHDHGRLDADAEATRLVVLGNGLAMQQVASPEGLAPAAARAILEAHLTELFGAVDSDRRQA